MKIAKFMIILTLIIAMPVVFAGTSGPSPIPNPPNFYISSSATLLCRGQVNEIPITVTNGGSPYGVGTTSTVGPSMQDVQLAISNSKTLFPTGGSITNISQITAQNSSTLDIPVFVSANASSLVSSAVSINYQYDFLYSDSEIRNLSFSTQTCPSQLSVDVSPQVLTAGNMQNITVAIKNMGDSTLNSIYLKLALPSQDGAVLSSQPLIVNALNPSNALSVNESVYIFKNASQTFPLNVSISFYNGTKLNQISNSIVLLSSGVIKLTPSSFTISPQSPSAGSIFSVSFILTNIGTATASAVTASAVPTNGFGYFGTQSVFVGDVAVDSQTPVTISLMAANAIKNGNYQIPIRINYINSLRNNITTWANTSVYISGSQLGGINTTRATQYTKRATSARELMLGIMIILIIIIIVLSLMLLRARRRSK